MILNHTLPPSKFIYIYRILLYPYTHQRPPPPPYLFSVCVRLSSYGSIIALEHVNARLGCWFNDS